LVKKERKKEKMAILLVAACRRITNTDNVMHTLDHCLATIGPIDHVLVSRHLNATELVVCEWAGIRGVQLRFRAEYLDVAPLDLDNITHVLTIWDGETSSFLPVIHEVRDMSQANRLEHIRLTCNSSTTTSGHSYKEMRDLKAKHQENAKMMKKKSFASR
jgi:hypothetical protein